MKDRQMKGHGSNSSHFEFPLQFLLGILFLAAGVLLILLKLGTEVFPLPEEILVYITAIGSMLGGVHMLISKLWRPRIYL